MRNRQFVANIIVAPALSYRDLSPASIYSRLLWRNTTRSRNRNRQDNNG
jgi:hypothetical protein